MAGWSVPKSIHAAIPAGMTIAVGIMYFMLEDKLTISESSSLYPISDIVTILTVVFSLLSVIAGGFGFYFLAKTESNDSAENRRNAVIITNVQFWTLILAIILISLVFFSNI